MALATVVDQTRPFQLSTDSLAKGSPLNVCDSDPPATVWKLLTSIPCCCAHAVESPSPPQYRVRSVSVARNLTHLRRTEVVEDVRRDQPHSGRHRLDRQLPWLRQPRCAGYWLASSISTASNRFVGLKSTDPLRISRAASLADEAGLHERVSPRTTMPNGMVTEDVQAPANDRQKGRVQNENIGTLIAFSAVLVGLSSACTRLRRRHQTARRIASAAGYPAPTAWST